jgi:hypothetical protein
MKFIHYARLDQREKQNTNRATNESIIIAVHGCRGEGRRLAPNESIIAVYTVAEARHHRMVQICKQRADSSSSF